MYTPKQTPRSHHAPQRTATISGLVGSTGCLRKGGTHPDAAVSLPAAPGRLPPCWHKGPPKMYQHDTAVCSLGIAVWGTWLLCALRACRRAYLGGMLPAISPRWAKQPATRPHKAGSTKSRATPKTSGKQHRVSVAIHASPAPQQCCYTRTTAIVISWKGGRIPPPLQ